MLKNFYNHYPEFFDTDWDGVFDDQDKFPLDSRFQDDADGDQVPDPIDQLPHDPQRWHDLKDGERREISLPTGELVYAIRKESDTLVVEVSAWPTTDKGLLDEATKNQASWTQYAHPNCTFVAWEILRSAAPDRESGHRP